MTKQIIDSVLEEAKKHNFRKILEVHLVIGQFTFLGIDQIKYSFKILTKGTIMEKSKLCIKSRQGTVLCNTCSYRGEIRYEDDPTYHFSFPTLRCPSCEGNVTIVEGKECTIKRIKAVV